MIRRPAVVALTFLAALLAAAGCESRRDAERRAVEAEARGRAAPRVGERPQALMVHFREVRGSGFSRETFDVEVLQLGSDIRLRGSVRSAARSVPLGGTLTDEEWTDLWDRLAGLPLDGLRVREDTTAADEGWSKQLEVDIVLGSRRRILSRNAWSRPPLGTPWLADLEHHLRALAAEHSLGETAPAVTDSTREAVERALENAMRDLDGTLAEDAGRAP